MIGIGHVVHGGLTLRQGPARDGCFDVVLRDADMHEHGDMSEVGRREMLHRHMANEITSIDIAAACIAEFPDAPWELRMELARQCADEGRHVRALHRRLVEIGGFKGEFPITTLEWSATCAVDNLAGRLAIQNRTLEAGAIDIVAGLARAFRSAGDGTTADLLDSINADEVHHVRFANRWIKQLAALDRRVLLDVATAVSFLAMVIAAFQISDAGEVNAVGRQLEAPELRRAAVHVEYRRLAEFSEDDIQEVLRQTGFRALTLDETAT